MLIFTQKDENMNDELQVFARDRIKEGLSKLPKSNVKLFKQMYSPDDLTVNINDVVDNMPTDRLDWAMQQVQRSLDKLE
jgi:hypothetical protein